MADSAADWQTRPEAGTSLGLRFLLWVAERAGRRVLHALLLPVSAYFFLVRGPERRASFSYLTRVFGRPAKDFEVLRHFFEFAKVTADRFFFLADAADDIPVQFVVDPAVDAIVEQKRPGIILAAHFGSFEAARVLGPELGGVRLRIVLDKAVNGRFVEMMANVDLEMSDLIIDSEQNSVALGLSIGDALKNGDWVGFLADRHRTGDRTSPHGFLGAQARFPVGPYLVASVFKAPIICAFCRLVDKGYEVHCEVLSQGFTVPRNQRDEAIATLVGDYVARLEHHVRASPYAWFNFFDFWGATQR